MRLISFFQIFADLPITLEEIDAKIHEHQVRAECTVQTDQRVSFSITQTCICNIQQFLKSEKMVIFR